MARHRCLAIFGCDLKWPDTGLPVMARHPLKMLFRALLGAQPFQVGLEMARHQRILLLVSSWSLLFETPEHTQRNTDNFADFGGENFPATQNG